MKILILVSLIILLGGCASAQPNFVNGKYYMGGDKNCSRYRVLSSSRIMCMDKDGKDTGYRNAMTDQQLQMYRHKQEMNQYKPNQSDTISCKNGYLPGAEIKTFSGSFCPYGWNNL